jgi:hypothetical protein
MPWTKTTKEEGADIVLTSVRGPLNPVVVFHHHLSANALVPTNAPLFAFETAACGWAPMTKPWFMESVSEVWKMAGLNHTLHGHGFRIGGASELLMQGVPPDVVATQGRWKSCAFLEFWRRIEAISPIFITRSYFASHYRVLWLTSIRNIIVESVMVGCHCDNSVWGSQLVEDRLWLSYRSEMV